jgi:hypothetical protein
LLPQEEKKKFKVLILGLVFFLLFLGTWQWIKGNFSLTKWFYSFSLIFFLLYQLKVMVLLWPVYRGFKTISHFMGWVNTKILLIIIYCFGIVPLGLFFKIIKYRPLADKLIKSQPTYWVKREEKTSNYQAQF